MFSTSGSSSRLRIWMMIQPTTSPIATPPAAFQTNCQPASISENATALVAAREAIR